MAKHKILLSQAILGFLLDGEARSLSPHTVSDYQNAFRKLQAFLGDPPMEKISADDIRRFLVDLSTPRARWHRSQTSSPDRQETEAEHPYRPERPVDLGGRGEDRAGPYHP
jgi:site-specific recombinase XerD